MKTRLLAAMVVASIASGCATTQVRVSGYLDRRVERTISPHESIYVMENQDPANRLFDREMALKIEALIETHGYTLAPREEADLILSYSYGTSGPHVFTDDAPIFSSDTTAVAARGYSYGGWGAGMTVTHVPHTRTLYRKWLLIEVVEGPAWREREERETVWVGEALSTDASPDMRDRINYMLVAVFEHFGEDTTRQVVMSFSPDDERVRAVSGY